ncbi:MAG TPA: ATP-binding protein, partial [Candidatus Saccharimonadales bacterium]|nr:ATP-binding protein [Candidatus Saccharimonadales bacterium]
VTGGKVIRPLFYAFVDPNRLREVLQNLIDNAIKYTPQGTITISLTGDNSTVQLQVSDTGGGIPEEDIPHLFQKFYRVDSSMTRSIGGTGLGLYISRKLIEMYNGHIWVESQLGKGSTFFINLPRLSVEQALSMQKNQANVVSPLEVH